MKILVRSVAIVLLLISCLALGIAQGWLPWAPSPALKMLPKPEFAKTKITGTRENGQVIDLQGSAWNEGKLTELVICSELTPQGWEVPQGITLRNGRLLGSIRIFGLGINGEAPRVRESSHRAGHTERAQAVAPRGIVLEGLQIEAENRIPLYLGPGVTGVTIRNCRFGGWSTSTAVYLDAESAGNRLENCTFDIRTGREVMAIDGSARNTITGNRFAQASYGGIYLYRNCGEGGTVRHQTPQENRIEQNFFDLSGLRSGSYGIWLGSRQGRRSYCEDDAGYPFGSSLDNRDFADRNTILGNIFQPTSERSIRDDGSANQISPK